MVATSCRRGTLRRVTGSGVSKAAQNSGQRRVLGAEIVTSPCRLRPPRIRSLSMESISLLLRHCAGVKALMDSAWTSSVFMRSPMVAYTFWWRAMGRTPSNAADTTVAYQWRPSPSTWQNSHGRPAAIRRIGCLCVHIQEWVSCGSCSRCAAGTGSHRQAPARHQQCSGSARATRH